MTTGPENFVATVEASVVDAAAARDVLFSFGVSDGDYDPDKVLAYHVRLADDHGETSLTETYNLPAPPFKPKYVMWASDNAPVNVGWHKPAPPIVDRWFVLDFAYAERAFVQMDANRLTSEYTTMFISKQSDPDTASNVWLVVIGTDDFPVVP